MLQSKNINKLFQCRSVPFVTVEYWFNGAVGVESGVTWEQDVFNQKLIPRPVMEIIIDKSRR